MIHPIPPGTRDVLPDEMRELRRLERALSDVFEARGYGEVRTPTIEYDEVLARGELAADAPGRGPISSHRFFDESGELLAMRSDMTLPIARLVSDRYGDAELPLRLYYIGNAFRAVTSAARPDARVSAGGCRADRAGGASRDGRGRLRARPPRSTRPSSTAR